MYMYIYTYMYISEVGCVIDPDRDIGFGSVAVRRVPIAIRCDAIALRCVAIALRYIGIRSCASRGQCFQRAVAGPDVCRARQGRVGACAFQCFAIVCECFSMFFNALQRFSMLLNAFALLFYSFQCFSMFFNAFQCFAIFSTKCKEI